MSKYEVEMCDYDELPEVEQEFAPDNGCGKDMASYIVILHEDEIQTIQSDAMEPEDCTFTRDLSWIETELKRAYNLGLEDGSKV